MSRTRLELLAASLVMCALALQGLACQDRDEADEEQAALPGPAAVKPAAVQGTPARSVAASTSMTDAVEGRTPDPTIEVAALDPDPSRGEGATGACSEADRVGYAHNPSLKFKEQLRVCGKETWADKKDNIACLTKVVPGLSRSCLVCFTNMAACAYDNCKTACMFDSKSQGCEDCANKHCQNQLIKCTGVARADLP
jgi:hypothetical protein